VGRIWESLLEYSAVPDGKKQLPSIKKANQRRIGQPSAPTLSITWDPNTTCKQNVKIFNVTAGGTHNNHWAWNVDYSNKIQQNPADKPRVSKDRERIVSLPQIVF
jgi:hypothetical protein